MIVKFSELVKTIKIISRDMDFFFETSKLKTSIVYIIS